MAVGLREAPTPTSDPGAMIAETSADFRVQGAIYSDPDFFRLEMDLIFGRTWVYVAHVSEIPAAGDYRTSYIGTRPVIVSRSEDGQINVLLNRCRHRGSVVCRSERGNAENFRCRYHGWLYAVDGALVSLAHHRGGYPSDIDKSTLGLFRVPRVDVYRGLIFANMSPDGPSLVEHFGAARPYIDSQFDRSPVGTVTLRHGIHASVYPGNWKFQSENSTDGYHGDTLHESFWQVLAEFGHEGRQHGSYTQSSPQNILKHRESGRTLGFENGHGILEYPITPAALEAMRAGPHAGYVRSLDERHGKEHTAEILDQQNLMVFPNLALLHGQIRVIRPIAHDRTEVTIQFYALDGVPDTYNAERRAGYDRFFGPSSFGSPDDIEIFAMNQTGLQAAEVEWLILSRGMARERIDKTGTRIGDSTDETPQRAFHRMWKRLMTA